MRKFIKTKTIVISAVSCLALLAGTANAKTAPTLRIENFIGTIDVTTSGTGKIVINEADGAPVSRSGENITIDAGYKINNSRCKQNRHSIKIDIGKWKLNKRGGGYKNLTEYPHMKISAPSNVNLIIEKSVIFGDVENIGSGDIHVRSCGKLNVGDVSGDMVLGISGSGDINMGDVAGDLRVRISGSGDAEIGDANTQSGASVVRVSGSGDLLAGNLASLELEISGSGDVTAGNIANGAKIHSSGSSDIELGRIEGYLDYSGSGSSDFDADSIVGDLSVRASGAGDITIDGGDVDTLYIKASGASNVDYDGRSKDAEAYASGAADISINRPTGNLRSHEGGAGDVHVDG